MNPPDLSNLSTFQMARSLQWSICNVRQRPTPSGRKYFVTLNGQTMLASEARQLCINTINEKQKAAGLF